MLQNKITNFFGNPKNNVVTKIVPETVMVPKGPEEPEGLVIIENYITTDEETQLLDAVNAQEWSNLLKRRVQHYGYEYNYQKRTANPTKISDLPDFTKHITDRLINDGYFKSESPPNQLIVNEYTPGQGIASHIDALVFGDPIVSISLGSSCGFVFTKVGSDEKIELFLKPRTLVVMSGESRYKWMHAIPQRKSDNDPATNTNVKRETRVSLTFRRFYKNT